MVMMMTIIIIILQSSDSFLFYNIYTCSQFCKRRGALIADFLSFSNSWQHLELVWYSLVLQPCSPITTPLWCLNTLNTALGPINTHEDQPKGALQHPNTPQIGWHLFPHPSTHFLFPSLFINISDGSFPLQNPMKEVNMTVASTYASPSLAHKSSFIPCLVQPIKSWKYPQR